MSHYSQSAPYAVPAAPYPGHPPPPGLEIPPPPHHPPAVQPAYHPYSTSHYAANNPAYPALPLGHQYPPGYAPPPPPSYASPPSAPPALYPDGRLAHYAASAVPPPPMSPYPPNPTPVVVYANGQPSPAPPLGPPQQGYYSSMLNSPLPSPHSITSQTRPYILSSQTSPIRPSPITSPQTNGMKSPISVNTSKSPVSSMKSPGAFLPPRSPGHSKSPIHAPRSPSMKSPEKSALKSPDKPAATSQPNGPLRSLEKMIFHEKQQSEREAPDPADCKLNILAESNPARSDSCRRRSSSHSGDDVKPNSRTEMEPEASTSTCTSTAPVVDIKKKRGRPTGSRSRKRGPEDDDHAPKRKRTKKVDAKIALAMKNKQTERPDKPDKLGPRIRVEGLRANPKTCTVINNISHSEEKDKKRGPEKERVNKVTESVKLTDAPWVCCFCGWGSTHSQLGDLFGPYQIEGFRAPRRESPKRRKRVESRCSEEGDRLRRMSGEGPAGEVWLHEECATWAEGVYMVGYRIQGLEEAARIARQTQCTVCKVDGATIGCLHKGCQQKYHYPCAIHKDCLLNEENFSLVCHKHKDKKIKMVVNRFTAHS